MGGKSSMAQPDEDEMAIIRQIDPHLASHGIIFYGIDTLVGDDGKRVLSEINTTSIGGLPKIAEYSGKPVVGQAAGLLLDYIEERLMD
jgi:glutathione synthase